MHGFLDSFCPSPRIYPKLFGQATAKLLPKLKSTGEGLPETAAGVDGAQIFNQMSWNDSMNWDEVRFKPLLVYLRGTKTLSSLAGGSVLFPPKFDRLATRTDSSILRSTINIPFK